MVTPKENSAIPVAISPFEVSSMAESGISLNPALGIDEFLHLEFTPDTPQYRIPGKSTESDDHLQTPINQGQLIDEP